MGTTFCRFKNLKQDINTSNAVKIFQQAASLGHKSAETLKEAQQFIEEHFEKVTTTVCLLHFKTFFHFSGFKR